MLHSCKLPKNLWGETITHVVWLKNRTTTCALPEGKTPYEMMYGKKPNLKDLHEWGVMCGYILWKELSWMVNQKLESGLVLMRLAMGIGYIGLINGL